MSFLRGCIGAIHIRIDVNIHLSTSNKNSWMVGILTILFLSLLGLKLQEKVAALSEVK